MRSRIMSIALGLTVLVAIALGIGYVLLRSDVRARQARTARLCSNVMQAMHFYREALLMDGPADSKERLLSPERTLAGKALTDSYHYCLLAAGVDQAQAGEWSLRLSLDMGSASVDTARQALDRAIERLARRGY